MQTGVPEGSKALRILVVGMTNRAGGLESFVMNYYEQLSSQNVHFDFLCRFPEISHAERIAALGGKVYHITRRSKNIRRFYKEIRAFFKTHAMEYNVLWDHECMLNDMTPLRLAKRYGIPCRIYHSHNAGNVDQSLKGRIRTVLHHLHRRTVHHVATNLWACSNEAARWAFPKAVISKQQYRIIPNAIPLEQFRYNPDTRRKYRAQMKLEKAYVVGNVGHLDSVKNQSFLLDAFASFYRSHPDAVLLLVGDGAMRDTLSRDTEAKGITGAVRFLGARDDVEQLLQAMDLFVMPSRYEGLGIAAVEAQTSGLPCLLSDQLPVCVKFRENVVFLPIGDAAQWSGAMAGMRESQPLRTDGCAAAQAAGYDIQAEALRLHQLLRL